MSLIYFYETTYDDAEYPYITKIKVKGDQWCRYHCADLHSSEMWFDDATNKRYVKFLFRSDSDLTAFRIGFSPNDI